MESLLEMHRLVKTVKNLGRMTMLEVVILDEGFFSGTRGKQTRHLHSTSLNHY